MSSYIFNMNAIRSLHKGYSIFSTLPKPKLMFYNTGLNKLISMAGNPKGFSNSIDLPIVNAFKIYYMTNFVLRRYYDEEFDLKEFLKGSKTAVEVVTKFLNAGVLNELRELVTPDFLEDLKVQTKNVSLQEKLDVSIDPREMFASYIHDINIINTNEEENTQKCKISTLSKGRSVEIIVVYHVLKGFRESVNHSHQSLDSSDFNKNLFVLTCRFIRDFNEDKSTWIISGLSHFKPFDEIESAS